MDFVIEPAFTLRIDPDRPLAQDIHDFDGLNRTPEYHSATAARGWPLAGCRIAHGHVFDRWYRYTAAANVPADATEPSPDAELLVYRRLPLNLLRPGAEPAPPDTPPLPLGVRVRALEVQIKLNREDRVFVRMLRRERARLAATARGLGNP
jgi:hypothetical protein